VIGGAEGEDVVFHCGVCAFFEGWFGGCGVGDCDFFECVGEEEEFRECVVVDIAVYEFECGESSFRGLFYGFKAFFIETGASDSESFESWVGKDVDVFFEIPVAVVFSLVEEGTCLN
jgi:hypothetical protein